MIITFLGLLLITIIGFLFLNLISDYLNTIEKVSLGYILSAGVFTFTLFILNILGVRFSQLNSWVLLITEFLLLLSLNIFYKKDLSFNVKIPKFNILSKISLGLLLLLFTISVISSLYWPVRRWDSITLYDFRAKSFHQTGYMDDAISRGHFFIYPLNTSLLHLFVYQNNFENPGIVHSLFFIFSMIFMYSHISRKTDQNYAFFWLPIIAMLSKFFEYSMITYTNLIYSVYIVVGILLLEIWRDSKDKSLLFLSLLSIGLSIWTRSLEPYWIIPLLLLVITLRLKILKYLLYPFITITFKLSWDLFIKIKQENFSRLLISNDNILIKLTGYFVPTTIFFYKYAINPYILIHLPFILLLFLNYKSVNVRNNLHLILFLLISNLMTFMGSYYFSITQPYWSETGHSLTRILSFTIPLEIYFISLVLHGSNKSVK